MSIFPRSGVKGLERLICFKCYIVLKRTLELLSKNLLENFRETLQKVSSLHFFKENVLLLQNGARMLECSPRKGVNFRHFKDR